MKHVAAAAAAILDALTAKGTLRGAYRHDKRPGTFMALSVEHLFSCPLGEVFAIAHRFEQNGDLCPDPDLEILRGADGRWYPVAIEQAFGGRTVCAKPMNRAGDWGCYPRQQADVAAFVAGWMRNVKLQQGPNLAPPANVPRAA